MTVVTYLWRSDLGQRIEATISDDGERVVFAKLFSAGRMTEDDFTALVDGWELDGGDGESFVQYLGRVSRFNLGLAPDAEYWPGRTTAGAGLPPSDGRLLC